MKVAIDRRRSVKVVPFQTKKSKLPGVTFKQALRHAQDVYKQIKRYTKRQPYVRSAYFNKQKVFFNLFWKHLYDKPHKLRVERLKYFEAAIDLIRNCRNHPVSKDNPNNSAEILHRFYGLTKEKELFVVQIKEIKRSGKKYLMSIFKPKRETPQPG